MSGESPQSVPVQAGRTAERTRVSGITSPGKKKVQPGGKKVLTLGIKSEFLPFVQDKTRIVVRATTLFDNKRKVRYRALVIRHV